MESMALINWYRQSQKHMLIQRVLSHSLAARERIYPRLATLSSAFFSYLVHYHHLFPIFLAILLYYLLLSDVYLDEFTAVFYIYWITNVLIYYRFGKTLFFEHPITNPYSHEERFLIEFDDTELRLVTNLEEWMQLRQCCRYVYNYNYINLIVVVD